MCILSLALLCPYNNVLSAELVKKLLSIKKFGNFLISSWIIAPTCFDFIEYIIRKYQGNAFAHPILNGVIKITFSHF